MNIAIYLRKSRAEENQNTEETLARHKDTLLKIAYENSYNLIDIFEEVASGENITNRPRMKALLECVGDNKYDAVLCMDIDRLGRGSMAEQGLIIETFQNTNTKIITPKKIYNLNEETDELTTEFETFIARMELKKIKKRMQRGKIKTIEEGFHLSEPPFGYERIYIKTKPSLKPIPEQAKIVRLIFDMYLSGENGCTKIAGYLNSINIKTRKNTSFSRSSVRHILTNPIYIGQIIYNRINYKRLNGKKTRQTVNSRDEWITGTGTFETIVTNEEFEKVQAIMKNNLTIKAHIDKKPNNPLSGLVICSVCGKNMQKQGYKGKTPANVQLYCPTVNCQKSNRFDFVEAELIKALKKITETKFNLSKKESGTAANENILEVLKSELNKLKTQKENLHDLLEQGIYDNNTFIERNNIITKKITDIKIQLNKLSSPSEQTGCKKTKERIQRILNVYENASIEKKNIYLKSIIEKIIYSKSKTVHGSNSFELEIVLKYL